MFEPLFTEESPNTFIYIWAFGRSRTCNLLITHLWEDSNLYHIPLLNSAGTALPLGLHRQPVYPRKQPCINQLLCQLSYEGIIYVKMDKLYLHFTQCFSLTYHQQHRIGCFLTLLSTTLLVVTLPPLTRFIFILICTWIGFSYVTPQTTFLPFFKIVTYLDTLNT